MAKQTTEQQMKIQQEDDREMLANRIEAAYAKWGIDFICLAMIESLRIAQKKGAMSLGQLSGSTAILSGLSELID